ncbi:MAG: DNA mismatch repair endonuclease MutL [Deltaproteobacteria bacterium]|nr:DNA mismatch repair endonuclease MutL [Deltaproteobacteria bacterium]
MEPNVHTSANKISVLPSDLINQIAAGEVVERPASVVKELVENSLDAGATRIDVSVRQGGIEELSVTDDGWGMELDDLLLCSERHATSKIRSFEDLERLSSYGFRGEALSSIASVAEVEIRTRTQQSSKGHCLRIAFGVSDQPEPVGGACGTSISVRHLFSRLPARQKFLRSPATEFSHCARIFRELALGRPDVSFFLSHQGKAVAQYLTTCRVARVAECLATDWECLHVVTETDDMQLETFLSPPHIIQDRGELVLFVNGRSVRNRILLTAIRNAYQEVLGAHHLPSGAVYFDVRSDWVDVNVHPQKLEVRLVGQEKFYGWILAELRKALCSARTVREIIPEEPRTWNLADQQARYFPVREPQFASPSVTQAPLSVTPDPMDHSTEPQKVPQQVLSAVPARFRYLGQIKASYLLCEDEQGIVLVDQHALHEKILYEKLCEQWTAGSVKIQKLLVPKLVKIPIELMAISKEYSSWLESGGFELEEYGEQEVAVKSYPVLLEEGEISQIVVQCLNGLKGCDVAANPRSIFEPLFATMACHSAVRAGQNLLPQKAETLLEGLDRLESGWTCPHGRPCIFRLSYASIDKYFER